MKSLFYITPVLLAGLAACDQSSQPLAPAPEYSVAATAGAVFAQVRAATAHYHDVEDAVAAGYTRHTPCIYNTPGARGYVYANPSLIDGVLDPAAPEIMLYEPTANGKLRLVGVAFVVNPLAWDAEHNTAPTLAGLAFTPPLGPASPNYVLTAWVWRHNPAGMDAFYNPQVSCEYADVSVVR